MEGGTRSSNLFPEGSMFDHIYDYGTEADEAAGGETGRAYTNWQEQIAKGETQGVIEMYERAYRALVARDEYLAGTCPHCHEPMNKGEPTRHWCGNASEAVGADE